MSDPGGAVEGGGWVLARSGRLGVIDGPHERAPEEDIGLGPALLAHCIAEGADGYLRFYRPRPTLAFSRRDRLAPGIADAEEAARRHGFVPVLRAPGGRAVAYHEGCVCLDLVAPDPDARTAITQRFAELAAVCVRALGALGVPAGIGPVEGEYCPGEYSVNASGRAKLVGTAQRIVRGGWLLSASIVVTNAPPVAAVLTDVYRALGQPFDVATVAAVRDLAPGVTARDLVDSLRAQVAVHARLDDRPWPVPGDQGPVPADRGPTPADRGRTPVDRGHG